MLFWYYFILEMECCNYLNVSAVSGGIMLNHPYVIGGNYLCKLLLFVEDCLQNFWEGLVYLFCNFLIKILAFFGLCLNILLDFLMVLIFCVFYIFSSYLCLSVLVSVCVSNMFGCFGVCLCIQYVWVFWCLFLYPICLGVLVSVCVSDMFVCFGICLCVRYVCLIWCLFLYPICFPVLVSVCLFWCLFVCPIIGQEPLDQLDWIPKLQYTMQFTPELCWHRKKLFSGRRFYQYNEDDFRFQFRFISRF